MSEVVVKQAEMLLWEKWQGGAAKVGDTSINGRGKTSIAVYEVIVRLFKMKGARGC